MGGPQRLPDVARPNVGGKAIMAVVRHPDRICFVPPGNGDQNRPEDLLAREPPRVRSVRKNRWHGKVPLAERAVTRGQPSHDEARLGPVQALLNVAANLRELALIDDGSDVGRFVEWIPDLQDRRAGDQLVQERVEDALVEEQSRSGRAGLALAGEPHGGDDALNHPVLAGVGVDNRRALATEFERDRRHAVGRGAHDRLANSGGSREADLAHAGMGGERLATFLAVARDYIDDTGRQVILADFSNEQHGQRSILSGLQDNAVSGADRRGDFQRGELGRRVPGYDGADDPKRFAAGVAQDGFTERDGYAFELTRKATEVAERVYDPSGFAARLCADGAPRLARDEARHPLQSGFQGFGDGEKRPPALPRRRLRPCGKRRRSGLDRQVDVFRLGTRDLANRLTPCRVLDHEGLPRTGVPPCASDQHLSREVGRPRFRWTVPAGALRLIV